MKSSRKDPASLVGDEQLAMPAFNKKLTIRQLFLFGEVMKAASQKEISDRYEKLPKSKISQEIKDLREMLELDQLEGESFWESPAAKIFGNAVEPLIDAYQRFSKRDFGEVLSIGSGGSLLGWLIGKRTELIRESCSRSLGIEYPSVYDVRIDCRPMTNRETFTSVERGVTDIGLVRGSLLKYFRAAHGTTGTVGSKALGTVRYGIAVPHSLKNSWSLTDWETDEEDYLKRETEEKVLKQGFFAAVGPEGEFRERLNRALLDARIQIQIEYSYRSFPQILPHLIDGTHFGLCPVVSDWKISPDDPEPIPSCDIHPLHLTKDYKRDIVLIWNKKLKKPWVNIEAISDILTWKI